MSATTFISYIPVAGKAVKPMSVKLAASNQERQMYDNMADLYSIIVATEHLERQYIKDTIAAPEYTAICLRLIAQFKTAASLVNTDISDFVRRFGISCPAAMNRLVTMGVPATVQYATQDPSQKSTSRNIAETVQFFITLMDSLKLNYIAVDQIHPQLSDLVQSLNSGFAEYKGKATLTDWLIALNKKKLFLLI